MTNTGPHGHCKERQWEPMTQGLPLRALRVIRGPKNRRHNVARSEPYLPRHGSLLT